MSHLAKFWQRRVGMDQADNPTANRVDLATNSIELPHMPQQSLTNSSCNILELNFNDSEGWVVQERGMDRQGADERQHVDCFANLILELVQKRVYER